MESARSHGDRDAELGVLVQPSSFDGRSGLHPAGRSRGKPLPSTHRAACLCELTSCPKQPPRLPGRFKLLSRTANIRRSAGTLSIAPQFPRKMYSRSVAAVAGRTARAGGCGATKASHLRRCPGRRPIRPSTRIVGALGPADWPAPVLGGVVEYLGQIRLNRPAPLCAPRVSQ